MGKIEDQKLERSKKDKPLGEIGERNINTNDFDVDDKTIKEQQNKE
ncbi:hypothetical protein [Croceiramulus getboli]|nr:hypothetical protein P8624_08680 [Flavobacteriaceae bacterium YJPT1-3]